MPWVTYVQPDGTERRIDVPVGSSVMYAAIRNDVRGIEAECGGSLSCATCHVYVDEADIGRLVPPDASEVDMLEAVAAERRANSRLSCQIDMTAALDGLRVVIPDRQI